MSRKTPTTTDQSDRLPSYVRLLFRIRSARPSTTSSEPASDMGHKPIPGSLQINLLFTIFAEQAALHRSDANFYLLQKDISARSTPNAIWWS
jgi:hypothetical protein